MADLAVLRQPKDTAAPATDDDRLASLIDQDFLRTIGWDEDAQLFRLPPAHPIVGWNPRRNPLCRVMAAKRPQRQGFCDGCDLRRLARKMTVEEFLAAGESISRGFRGEDTRPCLVPD